MEKKIYVKTVDEKTAARILGIAVQTLRNWRHVRRGPAYVKMGRSVRYQLRDIQAYIDERRVDPLQHELL